MALHVGHNCNPWEGCDVCGAKVEPPYRQRTDACAMCGAGFTVCRCRHQLREWRESMSVLDGPGEGTWSVFAQKVVEERDAAREEVARLRGQIDSLVEAADAARLLLLFAAGPHEAGAVPAMLAAAIERAKGKKP